MALTKAHNRMIDGAEVNAKDFGAVGNGVADDTAQRQRDNQQHPKESQQIRPLVQRSVWPAIPPPKPDHRDRQCQQRGH